MDDGADTENSVGTGRARFTATLVGLFFGQLVGSNSITIAKVWVIWRCQPYTREWVAEVSLQVIFVLATLGVCLGAFAVRRKWANFEQIVTSVSIAIIVALFAIVDHSLPIVKEGGQLPFWETAYYLGWVVGLWFLPFFLLPSLDSSFSGWIRRGGGLLVVSTAMTLACFLVGAFLEHLTRQILENSGWYDGNSYLNDPLRFWMARPITVNSVCGSYVTVAFVGIWWSGLWRTISSARIWNAAISTFAIIYTGVYGWFFYAQDKTGAPWQFFLAFAAMPAGVTLTVLVAYGLTRRRDLDVSVGWPVLTWFWWLLPPGFAITFGLNALIGFAPLAQLDGAATNQLVVLVVMHSINGIFLGLTLQLMSYITRLIANTLPPVVSRGHDKDTGKHGAA